MSHRAPRKPEKQAASGDLASLLAVEKRVEERLAAARAEADAILARADEAAREAKVRARAASEAAQRADIEEMEERAREGIARVQAESARKAAAWRAADADQLAQLAIAAALAEARRR